MPGMSRAIVQVCVSLVAGLCTLHATNQSAQTIPPPGPPEPQAAAPVTRPAPGFSTPEMRAFEEANRIPDRDQKLAALRKVQADLKGSVALFVVREVDEAILWHLVTHFPDRGDEIVPAFEKVLSNGPVDSFGLMGLPTIVGRLLDNGVMLDQAEKALRDAIDKSQAAPAPVRPANPSYAERVMSEFRMAPATSQALALEALGRLHAAQGKDELAAQDFKAAIELSPNLTHAPIALAESELKRGNKAAALDLYLLAAASAKAKSSDEAALLALYRDVRGTDSTLEAEIDRVYDKHFPNPIVPKPFEPPAGTARVVLLELFTGSSCGPCVSADLSWDAILQRYPDTLIAPLAYHAHIPGPDPMVVAGAETRRQSYQVLGVPALFVNGSPYRRVGGTRAMAVRQFEETIAEIDKAFAAPPAAVVQVEANRAGDKIFVTARATGLPAGRSTLRLHIVLAERHLSYSGANGIRHHTMVVRAIARDGAGIPIRGSSDTTVDQTFDLSTITADVEQTLATEIARLRKSRADAVTPPDYRAEGKAMSAIDPTALVVIAFVQDGARNVLQAARATVK